jgi:hypothetical protein
VASGDIITPMQCGQITSANKLWTNGTTGALADGGNFSSSFADFNGERTRTLWTRYQFTIPTGNTFDGVKAEIEKACDTTGSFRDLSVYFGSSVGVLSGDDKAKTLEDWNSSYQVSAYGNETDLWGRSWPSPGTLIDIYLHIAAEVANDQGEIGVSASIDFMRLRAYYTPVVSGDDSGVIGRYKYGVFRLANPTVGRFFR